MTDKFITLVHSGTLNTICNPHVTKFRHFFQVLTLVQNNLMTKTFHENFMFKGVKICVNSPILNWAINIWASSHGEFICKCCKIKSAFSHKLNC